jgi:iron(III) transport system permease protein
MILTIIVVWMSFVPGIPVEPGFTLDNHLTVFQSSSMVSALANTMILGVASTLLVLFFAVPMAWLIYRSDLPFGSMLVTLLAMQALVPAFLKAIGWILLLSPRIGMLNQLAMRTLSLTEPPFSIFGLGGMAFVQALSLTPAMFFLISGTMRSLDPALEEAAETSGATRFNIAARITFPLLLPAILGGAIYTFITAISIYEIPALLGGRGAAVLSTEMFSMVQSRTDAIPRYGVAAVYALLMMIPSIFAMVFYFRSIRAADRYAVITGKGYRPKIARLGRWKYPALGFVLFYVLLASVLPIGVLFWASLLPSLQLPSGESLAKISLANYANTSRLLGGADVIANTIILVVASSLVALLLSLFTSWVVVRSKTPGRQVLDTVAMFPHAIPGLAFAFAAMIVAILLNKWFGLPFYGTLFILVFVQVLSRLSYTTRITNAALLQVHRELEEAAYVSGADKLRAIWRILVPIIAQSLLSVTIWNALLIFKEVTMTLLLTTQQNQVLAVRVWSLWQNGLSSDAAALGMYMIVIAAALMLVAQRVTGMRIDSLRSS